MGVIAGYEGPESCSNRIEVQTARMFAPGSCRERSSPLNSSPENRGPVDDTLSLAEDSSARLSAGTSEHLPESVGGYKILRKIGEGGFGTVYEAEQERPRRTVALKVIRTGLEHLTIICGVSAAVEVVPAFELLDSVERVADCVDESLHSSRTGAA
jgi:hypothetical protein